MTKPDDAVVIVRDVVLRDYRVLITAERVERLECWHVEARVDGDLHDTAKSDYPEEDADRMLAEIDREYY